MLIFCPKSCFLVFVLVIVLSASGQLQGSTVNALKSSSRNAGNSTVYCQKTKCPISSFHGSGENHPWLTCKNDCCKCKNGDFFDGALKCDSLGLSVLDCKCVTYDNETGDIVVGSCVENCMNVGKSFKDYSYRSAFGPLDNVSKMDSICEDLLQRNGHYLQRGGRLCGKCLPGYSPLAYSYNMTCVNCTEGNRNLWKYFLIAFAPLTCFYFLVLFFKINTTSSHLHGFVLFSQVISLPAFGRIFTLTLDTQRSFDVPMKFLLSLYGIWNLDFFRMFNLEICLDMSPLSVRALDYMIAAYPFFLSTFSYILIELHDRNIRALVFLWKPFRCIFTLFRRNWDSRTSVIDAYATFYVLSSFKIVSISFDMLAPAYASRLGANDSGNYVLYYDGTIDYFGPEHLPYAIPAIIILFVCVILPILLLLIYPCRCFQYLLNRCHYRWHILHTFMDSFQGCYKDGTEPGTRDCRWFAGFDLLSRILLYFVYSFTLASLFFPLGTVALLLIVILSANVQPHKAAVSHYNKIKVTFYSLLAMFYTALNSSDIASMKAHYFVNLCSVLVAIVAITPLIYMACISIHWVVSRRRWGRELVDRVRAWRRGYDLIDESILPDRLVNPDQYQQKTCSQEMRS